MNFACMADAGYLRWTELCVQAIERAQPGARVHVFDLSESDASPLRAALEGRASVRYEHFPPSRWQWPAWIDRAGFDFIWPNFGLRESLKYHSRRVRQRFGARHENWMTDKRAHVAKVQRFLRLVAQKPQVIRRALAASPENLVFVDVDAIVLQPLDRVFERDFDLAVTCEEPADVVIGPEPPECTDRPSYPYKAINVGVMFFRNTPALARLIDAWIAEMESVRHLSIEQTALAHLIHRLAPQFFASHYRTTPLELGASVMALPMRRYNFTRIAAGTTIPDEVCVAHFAGGKKQEQHWPWVQDLISRELDPRAPVAA